MLTPRVGKSRKSSLLEGASKTKYVVPRALRVKTGAEIYFEVSGYSK